MGRVGPADPGSNLRLLPPTFPTPGFCSHFPLQSASPFVPGFGSPRSRCLGPVLCPGPGPPSDRHPKQGSRLGLVDAAGFRCKNPSTGFLILENSSRYKISAFCSDPGQFPCFPWTRRQGQAWRGHPSAGPLGWTQHPLSAGFLLTQEPQGVPSHGLQVPPRIRETPRRRLFAAGF